MCVFNLLQGFNFLLKQRKCDYFNQFDSQKPIRVMTHEQLTNYQSSGFYGINVTKNADGNEEFKPKQDNRKPDFIIDGLQYCNWDRSIFEQMRAGNVSAVHVTIVYWESCREALQRVLVAASQTKTGGRKTSLDQSDQRLAGKELPNRSTGRVRFCRVSGVYCCEEC